MRRILYTYSLIVTGCCLCLCSCITDLEIEMEPTPRKLVLNASVGAEKELFAQLSKSWFITEEPRNEAVKDARIQVYVNDQYRGVMQLMDDTATTLPRGQYTLPGCRLQAEDCLTLYADAPGVAPVCAQTALPPCVEILAVDTVSLSPMTYRADMQLSVHFKDREGEKNYYRLLIRKETEYQKGDSLITTVTYGTSRDGAGFSFGGYAYEEGNRTAFYDLFTISYNDPLFRPQGSNIFPDKLESYACWGSFADDPIDGQAYVLKSLIHSPSYSYRGDSVTSTVHYDVQLYSVTAAYYQYMKSMWRFAISGYPLDALKEPSSAYTNVEGGYGIVSGYQISSWRFTMPFGDNPIYYTPFSDPEGYYPPPQPGSFQ